MWDLIVSVPDHCLSFYFIEIQNSGASVPSDPDDPVTLTERSRSQEPKHTIT